MIPITHLISSTSNLPSKSQISSSSNMIQDKTKYQPCPWGSFERFLTKLIGGWTTHLKNIPQNGFIFPQIWLKHKKILKKNTIYSNDPWCVFNPSHLNNFRQIGSFFPTKKLKFSDSTFGFTGSTGASAFETTFGSTGCTGTSALISTAGDEGRFGSGDSAITSAWDNGLWGLGLKNMLDISYCRWYSLHIQKS